MKGTALITGASTGIGLQLAALFARDGYSLVIVARQEGRLREAADELEKKYEVPVTPIPLDLTRPEASAQLFEQMKKDPVSPDVLVNNAGFGTYGFFAELDLAQELKMIQLNVTALTELTRRFLPQMIQHRQGKILNVASTAAFQPGPLMAVYYATKAYVLSFSEAIANELRGTGVTLTTLCPGPTESEFQKRAGIEETALVKSGLMSSAEVARIGYRALMKGKTVVIPGLRNRSFAFSTRLVTRSFTAQMVRILQERKRKI